LAKKTIPANDAKSNSGTGATGAADAPDPADFPAAGKKIRELYRRETT